MGQGRQWTVVSAASVVVGALACLATAAAAQQPADTARRAKPAGDPARAPQPLPGVIIEASPAPKPATPAADRARFGGRLFTKAEIERVGARGWMDAVRMTPGVTVVSVPVRRGATLFARRLAMLGGGGRCTPAVFFNGMRQIITEYDWDEFLPVESVETMEVYTSTNAPLQYRSENGSCGSVLIWTRTEIR